MSNTRFQNRLKEARENAGFRSQQALASAFGVAQSTVGGWESGKREPDLDTLKKLAAFLRVTIDWLAGAASENTYRPVNPVLTDAEARLARVGSPQPVALLCLIYGVTEQDFAEICRDVSFPKGIHPSAWVNGYFSLDESKPVVLYPPDALRDTLADFFELPASAFMPGGDFPILPQPDVQKKLNEIKARVAVRQFKQFRALDEDTEPAPIADAEAI